MSRSNILAVGVCVRIDGLKARPEFNGRHGVVTSVPNERGRLEVRIADSEHRLLVNPDNLTFVPSARLRPPQPQPIYKDSEGNPCMKEEFDAEVAQFEAAAAAPHALGLMADSWVAFLEKQAAASEQQGL